MQIIVIDDNALTGLGLQHLLSDIMPMGEVLLFRSYADATEEVLRQSAHYFVSSRVFFEHTDFFRSAPKKTIVLVNGDFSIQGIRTLNICQSEKALVRDILSLHSQGHGGASPHPGKPKEAMHGATTDVLTPREREVAALLCKGYINKEIADQLNISLTTVICHRKNIMQKLSARSLADVIIHSVLSGYVNIGEL